MPRSCLRRARSGQLVALVALLVLLPTTAFADNSVIDSDPRPRTESDTQPGRVTIAFEEDLPTGGATIVVQDADGNDVTNGAYQIEANNIYADLVYPLPRGTYTAYYRVQEDDNEPFGGEFQFSYGPGDFPPLAEDSPPVKTWRGADRIPQIVALSSDPSGSGAPGGAAGGGAEGGAEAGGDAGGAEPESGMDESGSAADSEQQQSTEASAADGGAFPWIWYALAAAIVSAGAAAVIVLRRR